VPARTKLGRLEAQGGVVPEDRALEVAQLRPGVEPERVAQRASAAAEDGERIALAAAAVEREHELRLQPLAQRVLRRERVELGDELDVLSEGEVGVEPLLQRHEPQLLEARDLGLGERLVRHVRERGAAPERERLAQRRRGGLGLAGGALGATAVEKLLEPLRVELARLDAEAVPGGLRQDPLLPEPLA
jgi:hypothetical protein